MDNFFVELSESLFEYDMRKDYGYELIEEGPQHPEGATIDNFKRQNFFRWYEEYITGKKLQRRAVRLNANFGQHTAEYLLEHREDILEDWQDFSLVFPGTVWRDLNGGCIVPGLYWNGKQWNLFSSGLKYGYFSNFQLVCYIK